MLLCFVRGQENITRVVLFTLLMQYNMICVCTYMYLCMCVCVCVWGGGGGGGGEKDRKCISHWDISYEIIYFSSMIYPLQIKL